MIGSADEVPDLTEPCQEAIDKFSCLATWYELMPTDGTHIEVIQGASSAADTITDQEISDATELRKALLEIARLFTIQRCQTSASSSLEIATMLNTFMDTCFLQFHIPFPNVLFLLVLSTFQTEYVLLLCCVIFFYNICISVDEVFDLLKTYKITTNTESVRRWLRQGDLKGIAPSTRKEGWKIPMESLDDFLQKRLPEGYTTASLSNYYLIFKNIIVL